MQCSFFSSRNLAADAESGFPWRGFKFWRHVSEEASSPSSSLWRNVENHFVMEGAGLLSRELLRVAKQLGSKDPYEV